MIPVLCFLPRASERLERSSHFEPGAKEEEGERAQCSGQWGNRTVCRAAFGKAAVTGMEYVESGPQFSSTYSLQDFLYEGGLTCHLL